MDDSSDTGTPPVRPFGAFAPESALFRALELSQAGVGVLNLRTGERRWSRELYRILGLDAETDEPSHERFLSLVHSADRAAVEAELTRVTAEGDPDPSVRCRIVRPDGAERVVLVSQGDQLEGLTADPLQIVMVRDITGHVTTEARLAKLEEQRRHALTTAPLSFFAADAKGVITLSEGAGVGTMKRPPSELVGRSVFDVVAGNQAAIAGLRRALAGQTAEVEWDLDSRILHTIYSPVTNAAGEVTGISGVGFDVTAYAEMEHRLRDSERQLRQVLDTAQAAIFVYDEHDRVTMVNQTACEMLGYTEEELLAIDGTRLVHPDERATIHERASQTRSGTAAPRRFRRRMVRKDGSAVWVEATPTPFKEEGAFAGRIIEYREITAQIEAEQAARESELQRQLAISHLPIVVFTLDRNGIHTMSEGEGLTRLGLEPGELVGKSAFEFFREDSEILDALQTALDGEEVTHELTRNGIRFRSTYIPLRDERGQITGMSGMVVDVTELDEAETKRRLADERLQTILSALPLVVVATDADGIIEYVSRHARWEDDGVWGSVATTAPSEAIGEHFSERYRGGVCRRGADTAGARRRGNCGPRGGR